MPKDSSSQMLPDDDEMPLVDDPLPLESDLDSIFEDDDDGDSFMNNQSGNKSTGSKEDQQSNTKSSKQEDSLKVDPIVGWQNEANDLPYRREMIREM